MSQDKYALPDWCNGLVIFLFTPALLFVIVSAVIALLAILIVIVVVNLPWVVWCAITGRRFEYKFFSPIEKQKKEKCRE